MSLQAKQRDRSTLSFSEAETLCGKHLEHAGADTWRHEGRLITLAHDEQGRRSLVLDVGSWLVAIPSQRRDLEIGSRVEARLERTSREHGRESQVSWQMPAPPPG
jgi:hypothetical protein